MKRRSTDILMELLKKKKGISLDKLSSVYNVSCRTLKKDVEEINDFLHTINQKALVTEDKEYISLDEHCDIPLVSQRLDQLDVYHYKMSQEERCIYMIVLLAEATDYLTMEAIAEEMLVSRMTVLSDMDYVKAMLDSFNVALITRSAKGLMLSYEEANLRRMLMDLFKKIIVNVRSEGVFQRIVLQQFCAKNPLADFLKYIRYFEREQGINFTDTTLYELSIYLFVACHRSGKPIAISKQNNNGINNYSGPLLDFLSQKIKVAFDGHEKAFFNAYVLENNLLPISKTTKDIDLSNIIIYFLIQVGDPLSIKFHEDTQLVESLLMHIKILGRTQNIELSLENEDFPEGYMEIERLVNENAGYLERYLKYPLSKNMRTSIAIHICASLLRRHAYIPKMSVLIACPGSLASGRLLEAQIRNYFDFNIVNVVSARNIGYELEAFKGTIDFIISTVGIQGIHCPVLTVSPILDIEDLNAIQKMAFDMGKQDYSLSKLTSREELKSKLDASVQAIYQQDNIEPALDDLEALIKQLRRLHQSRFPSIARMLAPENILLYKQEQESDWKKVMRVAGGILENICYDPAYVDKMIENVEHYGPYIVIGPQVAIAHASADSGVYKDGLSLLVSPGGILFEGLIKVHLLFSFCSTGETDYLELFKEIIALGKSERVQTLLYLNSQSEIYRELTR